MEAFGGSLPRFGPVWKEVQTEFAFVSSESPVGPYWGTYGIVYRVLQPLLGPLTDVSVSSFTKQRRKRITELTHQWLRTESTLY